MNTTNKRICKIIFSFVFVFLFSFTSVSYASQIAGADLLKVREGTKKVRPTFASGTFYPKDKETLYKTVELLLKKEKPIGIKDTRAIIVPHAGYVYSGEVAAFSFREIKKNFKRVFIIASNHSNKAGNLRGFSIPDVTHYAIPGAEIPLSNISDELMKEPYALNNPYAHTMHMLEIELPFLYYLNGYPQKPGFTIIPIIVGHMSPDQIKDFTKLLNKYINDETLFVFSIDLSHFYNEQKANKLDQYSIDCVMSRDSQAILGAVTDGNAILATLIDMAQINNWQPSFLEYRTSGYERSNKESVVGYASIVFHDPLVLTEIEQKTILDFTRHIVTQAATTGKQLKINPKLLETYPIFNIPRASFVTLKKNGALRGCIGNLYPRGSLHEAVSFGAYNATLKDHRFKPVTPNELKDIKASVSILDYPQRVFVNDTKEYLKRLTPLKDGVIIKHKGKSSTYLPQVWEDIPDPKQFLSSLCQKQGAPAGCWMDKETRLYKYEAYVFGE